MTGLNIGSTYSRAEISEKLGGNWQSYMPIKDGRMTCICLREDMNPGVPDKVLVGVKKGTIKSYRILLEQQESLPVFLMRAPGAWEYVGKYAVEDHTEKRGEVEKEEKRAGRDLTAILYMKKTGQ